MVDAVQELKVIGTYLGRSKVRPGMESCLAPIEKKRLARNEDACQLDLKRDGTFTHKGTTWGVFQIAGTKISLQPKEFNGLSLETMQKAAEESGRAFGLAWLFNPFELKIVDDHLESNDSGGVVFVEYVRKG